MEKQQVYDESKFENENFVQECLDDFDRNVAKIEDEYVIENQSA